MARKRMSYSEAAKRYRPGEGGRFRALTEELQRKGYSRESARAIAATIGRRKYGARRMAQFAARGRRRALRRR